MRKKKIGLILLLFVIASVLGYGVYYNLYKEPPKQEKKTIEKKEIKAEKYHISLMAVGDALIHDGVYKDAYTGDGNYNFNKMFTYFQDIVPKYDLAFYNQETVIGGKELGISSYPCFNSPDEIANNLTDMGFNLVNLASNHTMDKLSKGAENSARFWKEKENIYSAGNYVSKEERDKVIIKEKNGITYSMLAYTYGTNGINVPEGKEYLVNLYSDEIAKADIEKVRDKVDILIVSMHWGTEYTNEPTSEQKRQAEYLSSLGVDIIIGTHPHVVQPITFIGKTLVIYSLGNFISAQDGDNKRTGLMVSFDINKVKKGDITNISIDNVRGDLLWTYHQNYRNFKVIPFSNLNIELLPNYEEVYTKYSKYINLYNNKNIKVGPLKEG